MHERRQKIGRVGAPRLDSCHVPPVCSYLQTLTSTKDFRITQTEKVGETSRPNS